MPVDEQSIQQPSLGDIPPSPTRPPTIVNESTLLLPNHDSLATRHHGPSDLETGSGASHNRSAPIWLTLSTKVLDVYRNNVGMMLILAAQAFFACMDFFVKLLSALDPPLPVLQVIWIRMVITYFCCMTYMLLKKVEHPWIGPPGVRWLLVGRGVSGFFNLLGMYYSLHYLSLSDATVLTFLAPSLTGVIGHFLLNEPFSKKQTFAGLFSLVGVVLIARPAVLFGSEGKDDASDVTSEERVVAVGAALLGVLGMAVTYTFMRAIGKQAHVLHSLIYFCMYCVIVSSIFMVVQGSPIIIPSDPTSMLFLFLIGIFGFMAQVLLVMGFQRETASRGSLATYTLVLFAALLEHLFLHAKPTASSILGAAIIISLAIYIAVTKPPPPGESDPKHGRRLEDEVPGSDNGGCQVVRSSLETRIEVKQPLR